MPGNFEKMSVLMMPDRRSTSELRLSHAYSFCFGSVSHLNASCRVRLDRCLTHPPLRPRSNCKLVVFQCGGQGPLHRGKLLRPCTNNVFVVLWECLDFCLCPPAGYELLVAREVHPSSLGPRELHAEQHETGRPNHGFYPCPRPSTNLIKRQFVDILHALREILPSNLGCIECHYWPIEHQASAPNRGDESRSDAKVIRC
mmetsp:Transcript_136962/g.273186  ORF Transcript_136962/g.273186 Transcript_136962/m.273186 type:complete len:200 (+) Transcript_136962:70-669(+)